MSKQLRLEVAELSDVGRRRDSNEDSMTRLVPKDPKVMERKGAIFVVADGMGGHAAGEVASEIAVETIREEYYEAASDEVLEVLAQAIRQANQVIYDRAIEQATRAGMGTTCVAVVVRGALVYVANVGDSRVYLIREGQIRQLTYDHSWVAEQVRAGMLTDDQARTHAHRNVITRALGTQQEVEPDLFVEQLQDDDLLLLCSDGLSGPVSDEEMSQIVTSSPPQEAVRELIAQANEQGGPDNITAVLVHVAEAPTLEPEMQEQLATLADASAQQTARLKPVKKPPRRLSPVSIALRVFAAVAILFLSLAIWDYGFGPIAWTRNAHNQLSADLGRVQPLIAQAKKEAPQQAINTLAAAQHPLLNDLRDRWLSSDDRQQAITTLQRDLGSAIRQTLQAYNAAARVQPLDALHPQQFSVSCSPAPGGRLDHLVAVQGNAPGAGLPALFARAAAQSASPAYALNLDPSGTSLTCGAVIDPAVVDLTTDGSQLYLLHKESESSFTVEQLAATPDAKPERLLTLPPNSAGAFPALLAVHNSQVYIIYRGTNDAISVCSIRSSSPCKPFGPSPLPSQAHSMTVAPNGTIYLLLVDGSIGVLTPAGALHPANLASLLPALPVADPSSFNPLTALPTVPVTPTFSATPTPPPANGTPTQTPDGNAPYSPTGVKLANATVLVSDQRDHLFIGDGADHRIVQLDTPETGNGDPAPGQQYAAASTLDSLQSVSAVAHGDQGFSLYVLGGHSLLVISSP
ncbi:MAG TPA: Stp1/IreP family PP2C-type Ser/Thr phosphatase [Ktedonobacterales bacterium]